jgi:predicted flap endonuclease-1-like 5' DNA nuclease
LRTDLAAARTRHEASEKSLGLLQSEADTRKTSASGHDAELARLKSDLAAAKSSLSAKVSEAEKVKSELESAKKSATAQAADLAKSRADLAAATAIAAAKVSEIEKLRRDLEAEKSTAAKQSAQVVRLTSDLEKTTASGADIKAAAAAGFQPAKNGKDDLTIVEGIGPKINELLIAGGIDTFVKLARASVPDIQVILGKAGPNFKLAQPDSWPRQARLCASGSWSELRKLQDELIAGVKPPNTTT